MKNLKYLFFSFLLLNIYSCNEVEDVLEDNGVSTPEALPDLTAGTADFSNYVALGNSLTIGVTDNGVFIATQENSYPNILAGQFAMAGGGEFKQAMTEDNYGGLSFAGNRIFGPRLVFNGSGPAGLESVIGPITVGNDLLNSPSGPFNNLGVPGARSFHMLAPGYGNLANLSLGLANPYACRLTGSTPDATMIELAVAQSPSFISLWIGANDVLSYATSGGSNGALTPTATFDASMDGIAAALSATGAQGVMANIPYVTDIPFFTTVPHNPVPLDAATAAGVNAAYAPYNGGVAQIANLGAISAEEAAMRTIAFAEGPNAVVIEDESLTDLSSYGLPSIRQATANDLVVLLAASFIGTLADPNNPASVNGVGVPLADNWVLTATEVAEITTMTDHINGKISTMATQLGYAHFDANDMFQQIFSGDITYNSFNPNASLVFGGMISLDGVHPTSRGYALIANEFLKAIDETFGSNFEASGNLVDIGDYPTNYSPMLQ